MQGLPKRLRPVGVNADSFGSKEFGIVPNQCLFSICQSEHEASPAQDQIQTFMTQLRMLCQADEDTNDDYLFEKKQN